MRNTESGGKTDAHDVVELARRCQVAAERLLDDDAAPLVRRRCSARPERFSCSVTSGNDFGGIDR